MNTTTTNKIKILLDLKPALDGYAGIPQESRLLFRGMSTMQGHEVDGLIQHGGKKLRPGTVGGKNQTVSKKINKQSRFIISLYEKPYSTMQDAIRDGIDHLLSKTLLRLKASSGITISPTRFEPTLFDDFIWRTFFNKTLRPEDKAIVTKANYKILSISRNMLHKVGLSGMKFSSSAKYIKINTKGYDYFIAQTPFPGRVTHGTQLIIRYHDAVPVLYPHTINDKAFHQASHFYALQQNVKSGAWFACVSEASRNDLLKIFPEAEERTCVIHNMISSEYYHDDSSSALVPRIIRNRVSSIGDIITNIKSLPQDSRDTTKDGLDYLLVVSTIEPRKNHMLLINAWERLKYSHMPKLKLIVVGNPGWDQEPIFDAIRPWAAQGEIFYLNNVPSSELRVLYRHATATVCPSIAEGFDYSGVEAMRCGGIVIASDIPVHREIYGNASEYFNPYSDEDAAMVIQRVLATEGESIRRRLQQEGKVVSQKYLPHQILPKWDEFLNRIHTHKA